MFLHKVIHFLQLGGLYERREIKQCAIKPNKTSSDSCEEKFY